MNGEQPSTEWANFLISLTAKQTNRMINICRERLSEGDRFPPTLGEFAALVDLRTKKELERAFVRFEANQPEGRAEKHVVASTGWNLKRATASKQFGEFVKYLRVADELELKGELREEGEVLKALPVHSAVSIADQQREEFNRSGKKHKFSDRIAGLTKGNDQ
ncbi:hypothetical protein AB4306_18480 [Vibrio splendidus]